LFNTTTDISVTRVLPHFTQQDIIFCLNEQNQLVPSEKYLSQFESSDIKRVENSNNIRWIALIIGHHGLLIRNCHKFTGPLAAKMRQLSIIGYTPIVVSFVRNEYNNLYSRIMQKSITHFIIFWTLNIRLKLKIDKFYKFYKFIPHWSNSIIRFCFFFNHNI